MIYGIILPVVPIKKVVDLFYDRVFVVAVPAFRIRAKAERKEQIFKSEERRGVFAFEA